MSREEIQEIVERVEKAESLGQFLTAADRAREALDALEDDLQQSDRTTLRYLQVRSMARAGATSAAAQLYKNYELRSVDEADYQSLHARILKDQAFETYGPERAERLAEAARAYEATYQGYTDNKSYNAINAATLYLLAGDRAAAAMARAALEECARERPRSAALRYWHAATVAEAALVLGDSKQAQQQLAKAGELTGIDFASRASTRKQLKLICEYSSIDQHILAAISNPEVVFFAGHIIAPPGEKGRFPADQETHVRARIESFLDAHDISAAFGSLASGTDIMVAEACIAREKDLGIVLPFQKQDFIRESVERSGAGWVERFEKCLAWVERRSAKGRGAITYATDGAYLNDDALFTYCAHFAMGLAMVRARNLDAGLRMLAVYDSKGGHGVGTDGNIDMWRGFNLPVEIISVEGNGKPAASAARRPREIPERIPRAMLFGDVTGFSSLSDEHIPYFHAKFMARLSQVLNGFGDKVLYKNSWGDAIYVVFEDALTAARCGLALQEAAEETDLAEYGCNSQLELRLGGHYGPVFAGRDFIRDEATYFGSHVTRTARIEPITPPGQVYVTEAMAAALAVAGDRSLEYDYVGVVPSAKNYGAMRMYVLKENPQAGSA